MPLLSVARLEMRFGERLIQRDVSFDVDKGCIFAIMGGSGCGKSTLLKHLVGLLAPAAGSVTYGGTDYWTSNDAERNRLRAGFGMLFQSAALWSSMTLLENVCLPLEQLARQAKAGPDTRSKATDTRSGSRSNARSDASAREARGREVLEWVELEKFADFYPGDISGGMKKRAGLARAIAAEPPLLFLDEPSAGLDPISSKRLDNLVLDIRRRTGTAVVFVSHELPSLFAIADDGIFLDADSKTPIARGRPGDLHERCAHPTVQAFLHREEVATADATAATDRSVPQEPSPS